MHQCPPRPPPPPAPGPSGHFSVHPLVFLRSFDSFLMLTSYQATSLDFFENEYPRMRMNGTVMKCTGN